MKENTQEGTYMKISDMCTKIKQKHKKLTIYTMIQNRTKRI